MDRISTCRLDPSGRRGRVKNFTNSTLCNVYIGKVCKNYVFNILVQTEWPFLLALGQLEVVRLLRKVQSFKAEQHLAEGKFNSFLFVHHGPAFHNWTFSLFRCKWQKILKAVICMKNDERPIKFTYMQRNQQMFFGINMFYKHQGQILREFTQFVPHICYMHGYVKKMVKHSSYGHVPYLNHDGHHQCAFTLVI